MFEKCESVLKVDHFYFIQFQRNLLKILLLKKFPRYEKCDWGWNGKMKKEEMTDDEARYLIARSSDGTRLGFSHFRFDMDFDDEVLYW